MPPYALQSVLQTLLQCGRDTIKQARLLSAIDAAKTFGAAIKITEHTPEWHRWMEYYRQHQDDAAARFALKHMENNFSWTVPSRFPQIRITPSSKGWSAWMAHVDANPKLGWRAAIEKRGEMYVETEFPPFAEVRGDRR